MFKNSIHRISVPEQLCVLLGNSRKRMNGIEKKDKYHKRRRKQRRKHESNDPVRYVFDYHKIIYYTQRC